MACWHTTGYIHKQEWARCKCITPDFWLAIIWCAYRPAITFCTHGPIIHWFMYCPRNEPIALVLCGSGEESVSGKDVCCFNFTRTSLLKNWNIKPNQVWPTHIFQVVIIIIVAFMKEERYNQSGIIDRRSLGGRRSSKVVIIRRMMDRTQFRSWRSKLAKSEK